MDAVAHHALAALVSAGRRIAADASLDEAFGTLAEAAAAATSAEIAVVRIVDTAGGELRARAISARSQAVAAELEGSRFAAAALPREEVSAPELLPEAVRTAASRLQADAVVLLPIWVADQPLASLELMRSGAFEPEELVFARLAAAQLSLAVLAAGPTNGADPEHFAEQALGLAGDALAAGYDEARIADQIVRLATGATGAFAARLWRLDAEGGLVAFDPSGAVQDGADASESARAAHRALEEQRAVTLAGNEPELVATLRLGQPPLGVLQLFFRSQPSERMLERLAGFGVRAAHALRSGERTTAMSAELVHTRALLAVVGQAIAQLSLSHTLETAAGRVAELLHADRVAVYLSDQSRLHPAYELGIAGPDVAVAERLLELALGTFRAQGMLEIDDVAADPRLDGVRDIVLEAGIEAAVAVPLLAHDELIGLLVAYLALGESPSESETTMLTALASQLAVAVQNAKLHEQAKRNEAVAEEARARERARARQLSALHEISGSFTESLSLEVTLDAVVRAAVELLEIDAAVIRMPDSRGDRLVPVRSHVAEPRLREALRPLLERPQSVEKLPGRRLFSMGKALVLEPASAGRLGASYELLVPFLEQGSSAVVIPIATATELLATLTVVSLDPDRRIGPEEIETALVVAGQAALAIDNARLYQQQKQFADTMQRSLLPQHMPDVAGLDVGAVYESSARVDVGGDVYDFLALDDGRLAAVLGDVTGHGIDATADMALAKFVFRSLAREHTEPADFLAHANEVVVEEVAGGKFITLVYLAVDPERGEAAAASAGHPAARLVAADGTVSALAARGLALGVEASQVYEEVRVPLPPGSAVCLYTDGIVEARRGDEPYGDERLEAALAGGCDLSAQKLAEHVVADCRAFAGGDFVDDCAVVVVRRV
jgi:serine phosphatase RsbU (regulator of sigma subunit)